MKLTIESVEPKLDFTTKEPKKTKNGEIKYKVTAPETDKNLVAYGEWVKAYVGKTAEFDTKDDSYMGNDFTIVWEPKLGKVEKPVVNEEKNVYEETHSVRGEEFDKAADKVTEPTSYETCNAMNNATAIWVASVTNGIEVKPWQELYAEVLALLKGG